MANDPVLQRSMFQKQTSVAPSVGLGIDSVTTPDQNAKALKSMFQPTVSLGMPTQMLQQEQQPVQSFQEGGLATPLIAQYNFRNRQYQNPPSYAERTNPTQFEADRPAREAAAEAERLRAEARLEEQRARYAPEQARYRAMEEARRAGILATERARSFDIDDAEARSLTPDARRRLEGGDRIEMGTDTSVRGFTPGGPGLPQSGARQRALEELRQYPDYEGEIRSRYMDEVRTGQRATPLVVPLPPPRPANLDATEEPSAPPPEQKPDIKETSVKTNLDEIKADRRATEAARTSAERRENMLLALMQAGFAMAAGRSPNAISNIGAGGQAGIAAFASMERARREDESLRRREQLQLDIAKMQYDRDPEAIRTYAILGGYKPGDPKESYSAAVSKGFNATQSKEGPKLAAAIINNPMSSQFYSQQELKDLADYARRGIIGMGAAGKEAFPGFSGTVVTPPAK
jgi:hypothetical protein